MESLKEAYMNRLKFMYLKHRIGNKFKKAYYNFIYKGQLIWSKSVSFRERLDFFLEKDAILTIGEHTFFNRDCSITVQEKITIGDYCIFGENVKMYDHNHIFKNIPEIIARQGFKTVPITIGNNCWFGTNVVVLKGVTVGDNCVISAGCIVDKDVPDNSILKRDGTIEKIVSK